MNDEQKEKLQQEVVRRYENLSDELKRAMMSVSSAEIIYEVGRKHDLNVEKIGILAEEVGYIMLGMVPPSGFISDLKDLLEIEENKAQEIGQEINHKIFLPIREEMKRTYGTGFSEEVVGGAPPQPTTDNRQPTTTRPIPPPPLRPPGFAGQAIPPRPTAESGLGPRPMPPPFPQRPVPPPIPSRPALEFGSGPRMPMTNQQPTTNNLQSTTRPIPPTFRPTPPPIFSQPKEMSRAGEIKQPTTDNLQPTTPLPEVEDELKPKKLLESLPKEKTLEARIAEKNPPKYHIDPYRENIE